MSLKEVDALTPQLQLKNLIKSLAPSHSNADRVIAMAPKYQEALSGILANTTRATARSYLLWKTIQSYASAVEAEETKPYVRFRNVLQGKV